MTDQPKTTQEAATFIAEKSPAAAGFLAAAMEANYSHASSIEAVLRENAERERDRWRKRALHAEAHVAVIHQRVDDLLAPPAPGELEGPP